MSWVPSSFNLRFFFPAFNGSASDNRPTPCIDKERQTSCTQMGNLEIVFHDFTLHFRAAMERKVMKYDLQDSHLRTTGLAFFINARGRPIVTRAAVEGRKEEAQIEAGWNPRLAYLA